MKQEDPQQEQLLDKSNNPGLEENLDRLHKLAEGQLEDFNELVKAVGSASNNALIMLAIQFALASLCTMLVNTIPPIQWIVGIIPTFNFLNFLIFVILCAITQYGSSFFKNIPWNFLWFLIHFCVKVGFLIFYGVQYPANRLDVFYFILVFAVIYVYVMIKDKESGHVCDLTVQGNFFKLVFVELVLSIYLCLLGQTGLGPAICIPIGGIIYTFFLLLEMQRFNDIEYLKSKSNSIYLGAAQIDADMVFFCSLAWNHISQKKVAGQLSIPRLKRYEQAQLIIPEIVEEVNIFDISPHDLAESLTQINEEFYSHLKFVNVLTRLDNNEETEFMKEYFNRVNSFSLYIQLCILREKDRHSAIQYFYDVCLSLCENEDQEGVFLIYHLAIERIDLEFLQSIQYISNEQQAHIKEMIKRCSWDYRHIYTSNLTKKLYPIPSFHNFWIAFKRIESNLKNTKKLEALEPLRTILNDVMFIRQANYSRWKNQEKKIDPKLKYFLQKGHQQELSDWFKIEIGNWNEIQLALMKMAIKLTN